MKNAIKSVIIIFEIKIWREKRMSLKIQEAFDENQNIFIVKPVGEIDIYTSENFKNRLLDLIYEDKGDLLVDCEELEFIDSTGLGALVSVLKEAQENKREITLKNIKPNIKKLFFLTKLDQVFKIEG